VVVDTGWRPEESTSEAEPQVGADEPAPVSPDPVELARQAILGAHRLAWTLLDDPPPPELRGAVLQPAAEELARLAERSPVLARLLRVLALSEGPAALLGLGAEEWRLARERGLVREGGVGRVAVAPRGLLGRLQWFVRRVGGRGGGGGGELSSAGAVPAAGEDVG